MTTYFPLIVNVGSAQIQELPAFNDLDLASSNIANAVNITATDFSGANITATNDAAANIMSANSWYTNPANITANLTVPTDINAMKIGPITVDNNVVLTVSSGATLVII